MAAAVPAAWPATEQVPITRVVDMVRLKGSFFRRMDGSFDFGAENGSAFILNTQPVIPVTVGDWNLINRALIPAVVSVDGFIQGTPGIPEGVPSKDRKTGLGDINYSLFLSPTDVGKLIWGAGASVSLPSATDDQLGSGKWSAGISGVALTLPEWGSMGILGRQLWSFAGDSDRDDVNQTLFEPFVNYNLSNGWYLISDIIIIANWEAEYEVNELLVGDLNSRGLIQPGSLPSM